MGMDGSDARTRRIQGLTRPGNVRDRDIGDRGHPLRRAQLLCDPDAGSKRPVAGQFGEVPQGVSADGMVDLLGTSRLVLDFDQLIEGFLKVDRKPDE